MVGRSGGGGKGGDIEGVGGGRGEGLGGDRGGGRRGAGGYEEVGRRRVEVGGRGGDPPVVGLACQSDGTGEILWADGGGGEEGGGGGGEEGAGEGGCRGTW